MESIPPDKKLPPGTSALILRSIDSRNQWRKIIDDGDVEIKDKIEF